MSIQPFHQEVSHARNLNRQASETTACSQAACSKTVQLGDSPGLNLNESLRVDTLSRLSTSSYLERLSVERPGIQQRSVETPADNHSVNAAVVKDAKVRVLYTIADIDDR